MPVLYVDVKFVWISMEKTFFSVQNIILLWKWPHGVIVIITRFLVEYNPCTLSQTLILPYVVWQKAITFIPTAVLF